MNLTFSSLFSFIVPITVMDLICLLLIGLMAVAIATEPEPSNDELAEFNLFLYLLGLRREIN